MIATTEASPFQKEFFRRILHAVASSHGFNREIKVVWVNAHELTAEYGPDIATRLPFALSEPTSPELENLANHVVKRLVRGIIAKYERSL